MFSLVFFFKQKTAYEMRISDWSSDVCSSDLPYLEPAPLAALFLGISSGFPFAMIGATLTTRLAQDGIEKSSVTAFALTFLAYNLKRSEEHTSELQSLMRISYAVFCLKKKKTKQYDIQILT